MKKILVVFLALFLCACAGKKPPIQESAMDEPWMLMQTASEEAGNRPYRLQVSLRFGEEGNTRRVTALIWGNNEENLRLDIMAGVGAIIAKISQNGNKFLLIADDKAYEHEGANKPLLRIGMPLPFDLNQLAALLNGRYADFFGKEYVSAEMRNGNPVYELSGPAAGELELNAEGLPLTWKQGGAGWRLEFAYGENFLPRTLKLANGQGKKAILLVRQRHFPAEPFPPEQMELELPEGVEVMPLSKYNPS